MDKSLESRLDWLDAGLLKVSKAILEKLRSKTPPPSLAAKQEAPNPALDLRMNKIQEYTEDSSQKVRHILAKLEGCEYLAAKEDDSENAVMARLVELMGVIDDKVSVIMDAIVEPDLQKKEAIILLQGWDIGEYVHEILHTVLPNATVLGEKLNSVKEDLADIGAKAQLIMKAVNGFILEEGAMARAKEGGGIKGAVQQQRENFLLQLVETKVKAQHVLDAILRFREEASSEKEENMHFKYLDLKERVREIIHQLKDSLDSEKSQEVLTFMHIKREKEQICSAIRKQMQEMGLAPNSPDHKKKKQVKDAKEKVLGADKEKLGLATDSKEKKGKRMVAKVKPIGDKVREIGQLFPDEVDDKKNQRTWRGKERMLNIAHNMQEHIPRKEAHIDFEKCREKHSHNPDVVQDIRENVQDMDEKVQEILELIASLLIDDGGKKHSHNPKLLQKVEEDIMYIKVKVEEILEDVVSLNIEDKRKNKHSHDPEMFQRIRDDVQEMEKQVQEILESVLPLRKDVGDVKRGHTHDPEIVMKIEKIVEDMREKVEDILDSVLPLLKKANMETETHKVPDRMKDMIKRKGNIRPLKEKPHSHCPDMIQQIKEVVQDIREQVEEILQTIFPKDSHAAKKHSHKPEMMQNLLDKLKTIAEKIEKLLESIIPEIQK